MFTIPALLETESKSAGSPCQHPRNPAGISGDSIAGGAGASSGRGIGGSTRVSSDSGGATVVDGTPCGRALGSSSLATGAASSANHKHTSVAAHMLFNLRFRATNSFDTAVLLGCAARLSLGYHLHPWCIPYRTKFIRLAQPPPARSTSLHHSGPGVKLWAHFGHDAHFESVGNPKKDWRALRDLNPRPSDP